MNTSPTPDSEGASNAPLGSETDDMRKPSTAGFQSEEPPPIPENRGSGSVARQGLAWITKSRRNLLISAGILGLALLAVGSQVFQGSDDAFGGGPGFEQHGLLLVSSARAESRVDLHVIEADEEPGRENLVLRDVTLERISTPRATDVAYASQSSLAVPVPDGFIVNTATRDDSYSVWFVGEGGEESAIELFDSRRPLSVTYAPGSDRLLIREGGDGSSRCYSGTSREPALRIGRGDSCWIGLDGTIAIGELRESRLDLEFYAPESEEPVTTEVLGVAIEEGSEDVLDPITGIWNSPEFFAVVAEEGTGRVLIHLDPDDGEEVYRSATYLPEDRLIFASGLRVGGVLEDDYSTIRLVAIDGERTIDVTDAAIVFADALPTGGLVFAATSLDEGEADWKERELDVYVLEPGAEEPALLIERVGQWVTFDEPGDDELLVLDRRDLSAVDIASGEPQPLLDVSDADDLLFAQRHASGGLYVWSTSSAGYRIDRIEGDESFEIVSDWEFIDQLHVDDRTGLHVVTGREVSGDDTGVYIVTPDSRRPQRVDRADAVGTLYELEASRILYTAGSFDDPRDAEIRELDIESGEVEMMHRGFRVVSAGLPRYFESFSRDTASPLNRRVNLFDECVENFQGTLSGATRVDFTLPEGGLACWRWDVSGVEAPTAWLHAGDVLGRIEVTDRYYTPFGLDFIAGDPLAGAIVEAPIVGGAGDWFIVVSAWDLADGARSGTLEVADAARVTPASHQYEFTPDCTPPLAAERAAVCLLDAMQSLGEGFGLESDGWAVIDLAPNSVPRFAPIGAEDVAVMPALRTAYSLVRDPVAYFRLAEPGTTFAGCEVRQTSFFSTGLFCYFDFPTGGFAELSVINDPNSVERFFRVLYR